MKPQNLKTRIFLDSGDPSQTRAVLSFLGFLDGQTTNPSLVSKNPRTAGKKFTRENLLKLYREIVEEISELIPEGSISIEVYADKNTTAEAMFAQGQEFFKWIPNAHIKYPTTQEGLKAAEMSVQAGMRVNMTLVFSQAQAAAVYAATKGAKKGDVFISPFVGRLDDKGENGMDLIKNIMAMYKDGDYHVEILTASVRSVEHLFEAINLGSDILTAPELVLKDWAGKPLSKDFAYKPENLEPIKYQEMSLQKNWQEYNLQHELTDAGLKKFADDWNKLII